MEAALVTELMAEARVQEEAVEVHLPGHVFRLMLYRLN